MFRETGKSVAMDNAPVAVKKEAQFSTSSNVDAGVSKAIYKALENM